MSDDTANRRLAPGGPTTVAAAAWSPRLPYVGKGAACVYVQAAATTAFPLYFLTLNYIEIPTINL